MDSKPDEVLLFAVILYPPKILEYKQIFSSEICAVTLKCHIEGVTSFQLNCETNFFNVTL